MTGLIEVKVRELLIEPFMVHIYIRLLNERERERGREREKVTTGSFNK